MNEVALDTLTLATFSPLMNTRFRVVASPSSVVELELIEAAPLRSARPADRESGSSFALCFAGPAEPLLEQRIYIFEHDRIGRFELFIVYIGKLDGRPQYEAVFNRPSK